MPVHTPTMDAMNARADYAHFAAILADPVNVVYGGLFLLSVNHSEPHYGHSLIIV